MSESELRALFLAKKAGRVARRNPLGPFQVRHVFPVPDGSVLLVAQGDCAFKECRGDADFPHDPTIRMFGPSRGLRTPESDDIPDDRFASLYPPFRKDERPGLVCPDRQTDHVVGGDCLGAGVFRQSFSNLLPKTRRVLRSASHRRIRTKCERTEEKCGQKGENLDHDGVLMIDVMNLFTRSIWNVLRKKGFLSLPKHSSTSCMYTK